MNTVLTQAVARLLLAPIFLIALAVLVKGYTAPGDGFSAGVIAALGIIMLYVVCGYEDVERMLPVRRAPTLAFAGLLIALLVAFVPVLFGEPLLSHQPPPGAHVPSLGRLELHTSILFDLGVFFLVFGFGVTAIRLLAQSAQDPEMP